MLKTLNADDVDVLVHDHHRVNRDHALQLPFDEQDAEMATDHQLIYDIEMESACLINTGPAGEGRSEWDRISSAVQEKCQQQTFNMFWGQTELQSAPHKDMREDSELPSITPNFPLYWEKQDKSGETPTAAAVEEDSAPLALPCFPLFWESQAKGDLHLKKIKVSGH
ncbi:hypothetical protein AZE42_10302 [Rhizopogon vesiculosus]|uniref:Uncharacterized protein n=1 Tax=Rhizopogon vesiculosus TaxID=180088 RepID=A0A1J8PKU8_9AGAM|nr:hypothetical protein AZE42_10302 [Rhizopogon vesiculosus]